MYILRRFNIMVNVINNIYNMIRYNEFLLRFALAKVYQCLNVHQKALEMFNIAIDLSNQQSPHCYFRRAWTYKV